MRATQCVDWMNCGNQTKNIFTLKLKTTAGKGFHFEHPVVQHRIDATTAGLIWPYVTIVYFRNGSLACVLPLAETVQWVKVFKRFLVIRYKLRIILLFKLNIFVSVYLNTLDAIQAIQFFSIRERSHALEYKIKKNIFQILYHTALE